MLPIPFRRRLGLRPAWQDIMPASLKAAVDEVSACRLCHDDLPLGARPVVRMGATARLLIVGQAPGTKVHETGVPWNDPSGERLRIWLDMRDEDFYDESRVAIMPMGFCYPGRLPNGGDAPPRRECAPQWHGMLRALLPNVELTLLVGQYAQRYYLRELAGRTVAETVRNWRSYGPAFLPLPHPSWRTRNWARKNPWFEGEVIPELRRRVRSLMKG